MPLAPDEMLPMRSGMNIPNILFRTLSSLLLVLFFFPFLACGQKGFSVTGRVENAVTGKPASNLTVTALARTEIPEDKMYEKITGTTDSDGRFSLSGLSPKYSYEIRAGDDNTVSAEARVEPLERGMTRYIESAIRICPMPAGEGIFVWAVDCWKRLDENVTFRVSPSAAKSVIRNETAVDCYIPAADPEKNAAAPDATVRETIKGESTLTPGAPHHALKSPVILAYSGKKYGYYQIAALYYYRGLRLASVQGDTAATPLPRGFHWGVASFRCRAPGSRLYVERLQKAASLSWMCRDRVGGLVFGRLDLAHSAYYGILPSGSLDVNDRDVQQAVSRGIQGIVFRIFE